MLARTLGRAAVSVAVALTLAGSALAAEFKPFTQKAFDQAQADGRPIIIEAHAWWCSTCRAQEPALRKAAKDPAFDEVIVFKMNYDGEKKARRELGIQQQSTLIAFNGDSERARSVGDTNEASIAALLRKALN